MLLTPSCGHFFGGLLLTITLVSLSYVDIRTLTLPDGITQPVIWLGLCFNILYPFTSLDHAILGCVSGYLFFIFIAWLIAWLRNREGLGRGDAKLLALLGAWLGVEMLPAIIFLASFSGAVFGVVYIISKNLNATTLLPFGPFLALAGILGLLWKPEILQYQHLLTHIC